MQIEAGRRMNLVDGEKVEHLRSPASLFVSHSPPGTSPRLPGISDTKPWTFRPEAFPGAVRVWGEGKDIRIANCSLRTRLFPHSHPRRILAGQRVDDVHIEDNDFRYTDDGILSVSDGSGWGYAQLRGRLGDVRIYRNHSLETGRRPARYSTGTGMEVAGARTLEIAGNIIERSYGQGIDVHGSKVNGCWGDVPFTRLLIHHNKVWESMLNCNDFGGIETWQGGPFYVFDNISYNALGYQNWARYSHDSAGFGHAYYLDGAFKNYHFNNIAWGKAKDVESPVVNCSAFQEIISYQNTFLTTPFTITTPARAARNPRPAATSTSAISGAGSASLSSATPTRPKPPLKAKPKPRALRETASISPPTPMAATCSTTSPKWAFLNPPVAGSIPSMTLRSNLVANGALLTDLGAVARQPPLRDPAHGDFRPAPERHARRQGVRPVVPLRRRRRMELLPPRR